MTSPPDSPSRQLDLELDRHLERRKLVTPSPSDEEWEDHFFHHDSWSEPWSHPEFEDISLWKTQTWYRQGEGMALEFLSRNRFKCHWPWGYLIYRTVYTPESDRLWPEAMAKLGRYMHHSFSLRLKGKPITAEDESTTPERLVAESWRDVILQDPERLDDASVGEIRLQFRQYLKSTSEGIGGNGRHQACLMIDERSLRSIIAAPEPGEHIRAPQPGFVGAVDAQYREGLSGHGTVYKGFMRTDIADLFDLYGRLGDGSLEEICGWVLPGLIPFYSNWETLAQDEEGTFHTVITNRGGRPSQM